VVTGDTTVEVVVTTAEEGTTEEVTLVEAAVMVGAMVAAVVAATVVAATDPLRMSDGRRKYYSMIK
jgi:mannose/fructose/N-acetylgalactosamine-specific phosphotransferase system component IID